MYYLRTQAAADAIKFTVDRQQLEEAEARATEQLISYQNEREETDCLNCGS
jgi:hypothetical protein